jgi:proline dehydrogenase
LSEARALQPQGVGSAIGFWNRADDSSDRVAEEYLASLERVRASGLNCHLSIKPLALAFRPDLLAAVVHRARDLDLRLQFDSPSAESADISFTAIGAAACERADLGCTLPGRWQRSMQDADWAIEHNLSIRVVKGHWPDPENPLRDVRLGFLAVIDRIAGRARRVSIATHDTELARAAISHLRSLRTSCELEVLMGPPAAGVIRLARTLGVPVRAYIAYGEGPLLWANSAQAARP